MRRRPQIRCLRCRSVMVTAKGTVASGELALEAGQYRCLTCGHVGIVQELGAGGPEPERSTTTRRITSRRPPGCTCGDGARGKTIGAFWDEMRQRCKVHGGKPREIADG